MRFFVKIGKIDRILISYFKLVISVWFFCIYVFQIFLRKIFVDGNYLLRLFGAYLLSSKGKVAQSSSHTFYFLFQRIRYLEGQCCENKILRAFIKLLDAKSMLSAVFLIKGAV